MAYSTLQANAIRIAIMHERLNLVDNTPPKKANQHRPSKADKKSAKKQRRQEKLATQSNGY